jgi:sugar phosphate isomerase/epimerase
MPRRYSLGIVELAFRTTSDHAVAAAEAARLGFDHIDIVGQEEAPLAVPVVDRYTLEQPPPGWSTGAPPEGPGRWERAVARFRRTPGARIEPWGGSIINTVEKVKAFVAEVPGTRLLLDTGHVAAWGEDPAELIPFAGHIQLRQARPGVIQALEGDIDWPRFFGELRRCGYDGALSIEYFDLPEMGLPLEDPVEWSMTLAAEVRPLLAGAE